MRKLLGLVLFAGAVAVLTNEDLRRALLDALFGAEEDFEYVSTTIPADP